MNPATTAPAYWARNNRVLFGNGESTRVDPGVGPSRYRRALEVLLDSGRDIAMASFTFDPDEPGSVIEIPESFSDSEGLPTPVVHVKGRLLDDGRQQWQEGFVKAIEAIDAEVVDKVVLTRQVDFELEAPISIPQLTARLRAGEPDSYTFHVAGLVGASPELLVSLMGGRVNSLALAGTAREAARLETDKMDREHELSRSSVEAGLSPHTESLQIKDRTVRRFGQIQHLASEFEGKVGAGTTVVDLLSSMHPTAAVAGTPADTSLKVIKDLETRSRGRYAGPVGWFNTRGEGEFAIALRCGLVEGTKATLYAGGGIVVGSDVGSEYRETELKLQPMLRALGLQVT